MTSEETPKPSTPIGPVITEPPVPEALSRDLAFALDALKAGATHASPLSASSDLPMIHIGQVSVGSNGDQDLPCYGYARDAFERLVYINVAGPRTSVESMRGAILKGAAVSVSTKEGSKRLIPSLKLEKDQPSAYTTFEYAQADTRVRNVVMILRTLYESKPGQPQSHLLYTPDAARNLLRVVADLTGLPLLYEWALPLWRIAEDAKLVTLCEGAPISIYRITGDKASWRSVVQSALNQQLLIF